MDYSVHDNLVHGQFGTFPNSQTETGAIGAEGYSLFKVLNSLKVELYSHINLLFVYTS